MKSGSKNGEMSTSCLNVINEPLLFLLDSLFQSLTLSIHTVKTMIDNGQIVPSYVTVALLQQAMKNSSNSKFLIDGFPRNAENNSSWEKAVRHYCTLFNQFSSTHLLTWIVYGEI